MKKNDRAKKIERAIVLTWDSLVSHLEGTHTISSTGKKYVSEVGDQKFHRRCVKDYAEVIKILSDLY